MSAIFGVVDKANLPIDAANMGAIGAALRVRGPDGLSIWNTSGCALGHCLLDVAENGPPLGQLFETDHSVTVADCRLDNREMLLDMLRMPATSGDAALISSAYDLWGSRCPEYFLGDFSFAIWDVPRRQLFCARDHFGIKPLFYHEGDRYFIFASSVSGIFGSNLVEQKVRQEAVADFIAGIEAPREETLYEGVHRLPAAHTLRLAPRAAVAAYWSLSQKPKRVGGDSTEMFRELFTRAVSARMRGGPVGTMLSGGLDSSSVTCVARSLIFERATDALPTFSLVFDETPELNERPYIEAVIATGGLSPCFIQSNNISPTSALSVLLKEQGGLFDAPNLATSRNLYRRAREAGVKVLLDGHGGDEVAPIGVGRLRELALGGHWYRLWQNIEAGLVYDSDRRLSQFWAYLAHYGPAAPLRRIVARLRREFRGTSVASWASDGFIDPDFAKRYDLAERRRRENASRPWGAKDEFDMHYRVLSAATQTTGFEVLDNSAAAAGVEARYPFWDKRLVEFCLSLAPEDKLDRGWGRLVLRRAMEGIIPESIQWRRTKFSFTQHVLSGLLMADRNFVENALADSHSLTSQYVNLHRVRQCWERLTKSQGAPNPVDVSAVWRTLELTAWLSEDRNH